MSKSDFNKSMYEKAADLAHTRYDFDDAIFEVTNSLNKFCNAFNKLSRCLLLDLSKAEEKTVLFIEQEFDVTPDLLLKFYEKNDRFPSQYEAKILSLNN